MVWKSWRNKLRDYEQWRQRTHVDRSSARWWAYTSDAFFEEALTLSGSGICLDVGCGIGHFLCGLVKDGEYEGIGLDPIKELCLKPFKGRVKNYRVSEKIELIKGVGEYLPIKNDCIQLCIISATLDHVNDPDQTLKEVYRVLVHNGYFMLLQGVAQRKEPDSISETHLHQFTMADLEKLLKEFTIEKTKKLFRITSRVPIPDELLDSSNIYRALNRIYSLIGRCSKGYVVIIKSKKN